MIVRFLPLLLSYSKSCVLGIGAFVEPIYVVYDHSAPLLDNVNEELKALYSTEQLKQDDIVEKARSRRIERVEEMNDAAQKIVCIPPTESYFRPH